MINMLLLEHIPVRTYCGIEVKQCIDLFLFLHDKYEIKGVSIAIEKKIKASVV